MLAAHTTTTTCGDGPEDEDKDEDDDNGGTGSLMCQSGKIEQEQLGQQKQASG